MFYRIARCGIVFLICCAGLAGCTKKADGLIGPAGPQGNSGGSATNVRTAITGFVRLVNQYDIPVQVYDSVQVSTRMGDSLISVTTDASGKFTLPALKSGTYRILFQRRGYDSLAVNITHSAGKEDKFIGIVEMDGTLTTHVLDQTLNLYNSRLTRGVKYLDVTTSVDGPPLTLYNRRYFSIYFSRTAGVSDQQFFYRYDGNSNMDGTNQMFTQLYFQDSLINNVRMHTGDSLYIKTYFMPAPDLRTAWFDSNTYQNIPYPYKGDSVVRSFVWTK